MDASSDGKTNPENLEQIVLQKLPRWQKSETSIYPLSFQAPAENIRDDLLVLRDDPELRFEYLSAISAVDWKDYFVVHYFLCSLVYRCLIGVEARLDDRGNPEIESVTHIWPTADWHERETYDLMGIRFRNHPDLKRIYLNHSFQGFPLRKDFVDQRPRRNRRIRTR